MLPLCKTAVPIFCMIAGVNLLDKQESIKELFCKRVMRYIIIILLFGSLHFMRYVRGGKIALTIANWVKAVYSEPIIEAYWFLYLYLGFLLLLPLLRKMTKQLDKNDYIYLYALMVICRILVIIGYVSGIMINGYVFSIIGSTAFFYPIIGYGIDKYSTRKDFRKYVISAVASLVLIVVISTVYKYFKPDDTTVFSDLLQAFTPMIACAIFGAAKCICRQTQGIGARVLVSIGGTTFGIYLLEELIRKQLEKILDKIQIYSYVNDFAVVVGFVVVTFIIGVCIVYVLKKIPLLRKIL